MNTEIDPAKVLYILGALFGIAAVLYFARDIVFELSITVRAALLFLGFVVLLIAALTADRQPHVPIFTVLAGAAYLAFVGYSLSRFEVGADGTFFVLLVSAALLIGLGYLVRERDIAPSRRTAQYAVLAIALVAVALIGADVVASGVSTEMTVPDQTSIDDDGQVIVGTLTMDNRFVFREPIDVPSTFACLYVPGMEYEMRPTPVQFRVDSERVPDSLAGSATVTAQMQVRLTEEERTAIDEPIQLERADDCQAERTGPRIVVVTGTEMPRPPRP